MPLPADCPECGGPTEWDDHVSSDVCLLCGTLASPSNSNLTHELEYNTQGNDTYQSAHGAFALHNPLRVVDKRGRHQFESSAASKEARTYKHKLDMRSKIQALAQAVSAQGVCDRATFIFEAVMDTGKYRWGRSALILAAASVSIALREGNKPGSIRELSATIETQSNNTFRTFSKITALLGLKVAASANPESLFPALFQGVEEACQPGGQALTKPLVQFFKALDMGEVTKLANSLATLTATLIIDVSIAPTACALFVVAAEAQAKGPIPNLKKDLLPFLGTIVGMAGTKTISGRLKFIRDEIDKWKTLVPWLENNASFGGGRGNIPRGKRKRVIAVRGIKDLIDMEMDKWDSKIVKLTGDMLSDDEAEDGPCPPPLAVGSSTSSVNADDDEHRASSSRGKRKHPDDPPRVDKRRKMPLKEQSYRFILDPTNSSLYSASPLPRVSEDLTGSTTTISASSSSSSQQNSCLRLSNFMLSAPSYALTKRGLPSRLTLLASERHGAENVTDDELFQPGELEGFFRNDNERQEMRQVWGWQDGVGDLGWEKNNLDLGPSSHAPDSRTGTQKGRRAEGPVKTGSAGSQRINMSAFKSFFSAEGDAAGDEDGDDDMAYASLGLMEGDDADLAGGFVVGTIDDSVGESYDLMYPTGENDDAPVLDDDKEEDLLYPMENDDNDYTLMEDDKKVDLQYPMENDDNDDKDDDFYFQQECD